MKFPPAKRPPFALDLSSVIVVFVDILPIWGLFGIIKQICHASVGILMEFLPSGGWFSLRHRPRENHPPSGRHSIRIPTLAWHICILSVDNTLDDLPTSLTYLGRRLREQHVATIDIWQEVHWRIHMVMEVEEEFSKGLLAGFVCGLK